MFETHLLFTHVHTFTHVPVT